MDGDVHKYYSYSQVMRGRVAQRLVAQAITNRYFGVDFSITKLRKLGVRTVGCYELPGPRRWTSKPISFDLIDEHLFRYNKFNHREFDLFEIRSDWLDGSIELVLPQHVVGSDAAAVTMKLPMTLGSHFPLCPSLDREGVLYNSFQNSLAERIISLHHRLVNQSEAFVSHDWLYDFIAMVSNCISIVDITLNQLYLKAEYDPRPGWNFTKDIVGERFNRRLKDKLHWIKQITGVPPDNIETELQALNTLKGLRNHTQHFDPPCFGFTLEEATEWLNMVSQIGSLLFKIRKLVGTDFNEQIVEMILLPRVEFHGKVLFDRSRLPHGNTGYATTRWNDETDDE